MASEELVHVFIPSFLLFTIPACLELQTTCLGKAIRKFVQSCKI